MINGTSFTFMHLVNFWYRRWMRTLPAYFFVLTLLILYRVFNNSDNFSDYYRYYIFTQSFFFNYANLYTESWSLCIEEWFYLLMPVLFFISIKFKRSLLVIIFSIIVICLTLTMIKAGTTNNLDQWNRSVRQVTVLRFDAIMFGVLGAYLSYFDLWINRKALFVFGVILFVAVTACYDIWGFTDFIKYSMLPLQSIAVFCCLPFLENVKAGRGLVYRIITFISIISYSMYLLCLTPFHIINVKISNYTGIHSASFSFSLYLVIVFGGSYLLNRCIEMPFMNLRDKMGFVQRAFYKAE